MSPPSSKYRLRCRGAGARAAIASPKIRCRSSAERVTAAEGPRPDLTVVLATHHLEEIPPSATHAALLRDGCLVSSGPIHEALTREHLAACFGIEVEVSRHEGRWFGAARMNE